MAVVLVLFACAAAAAVWFVRSPQATIKDKENGDKVDVSSLLNSAPALTMCLRSWSAQLMRTKHEQTL